MNTACLIAIVVLAAVATNHIQGVNYALWYQISLMEDADVDDYSVDNLREPGEPSEAWPYWNMAVRANPPVADLLEIGYLMNESSCQITEKNFCTEIAYIWRKFETDATKRAVFKAQFFDHLYKESRGDQEIRPRRRQQ